MRQQRDNDTVEKRQTDNETADKGYVSDNETADIPEKDRRTVGQQRDNGTCDRQ